MQIDAGLDRLEKVMPQVRIVGFAGKDEWEEPMPCMPQQYLTNRASDSRFPVLRSPRTRHHPLEIPQS
jgi:hypothetical protein